MLFTKNGKLRKRYLAAMAFGVGAVGVGLMVIGLMGLITFGVYEPEPIGLILIGASIAFFGFEKNDEIRLEYAEVRIRIATAMLMTNEEIERLCEQKMKRNKEEW